LPYHRKQVVAPGITATLLDAGHVLGSAVVVLDIVDGDQQMRLAFTGDLGHVRLPILRDPEVPTGVQCLITESTYGDRNHGPMSESIDTLASTIAATVARGGKVIIPTFALERAQEVIFALKRLRADGRLPHVPVYVDSPLTVKITDVFRLHPECFSSEMVEQLRSDDSPFDFAGLQYVSSVEESKAIDALTGPAVILAGSGMCEGGRVLHHLRNGIEDARNTVLIVGFQAEHTLGRRLVELRRDVRIFGVMHPRNAEVISLDGLSAHADRHDLLDFAQRVRNAGSVAAPLRQIVVVHGEPAAQDAFAATLRADSFANVVVPTPMQRIVLSA
jgi:metallo-beta-lactamase family protein